LGYFVPVSTAEWAGVKGLQTKKGPAVLMDDEAFSKSIGVD